MRDCRSLEHHWRWFPAAGRPRGVVSVVHGLNNRPGAMNGLIRPLTDRGFHALRLSLHECARPPEPVDGWWCDLLCRAHREALARAPGLPLLNVSYSLGALVALECFRDETSPHPVACVFLAPALALTPTAALIRVLVPIRRIVPALKSGAPKEIRARDRTPLTEYAGLLRLMERMADGGMPWAAARTPTLVLMSPKDDVVSHRKVARLVGSGALEGWSLAAVSPQGAGGSHHLLIAAKTVGAACWSRVVEATAAHLEAHALVGACPDGLKPEARGSRLQALRYRRPQS